MVWIRGKDNVEADILSWHPCAQATAKDELKKKFFTAQTALTVICFAKASSTQDLVNSMEPQESEASINTICPVNQDITDDHLRELW
jgi:hypothetical protein